MSLTAWITGKNSNDRIFKSPIDMQTVDINQTGSLGYVARDKNVTSC